MLFRRIVLKSYYQTAQRLKYLFILSYLTVGYVFFLIRFPLTRGWQSANASFEDKKGHDMGKWYCNVRALSLYTPLNNSSPDKIPMAELGIEPRIPFSISIDLFTYKYRAFRDTISSSECWTWILKMGLWPWKYELNTDKDFLKIHCKKLTLLLQCHHVVLFFLIFISV